MGKAPFNKKIKDRERKMGKQTRNKAGNDQRSQNA